MSSLDDVCSELRKFGINIDADAVRRAYPDEELLARVERNLWEMLRTAESERERHRQNPP